MKVEIILLATSVVTLLTALVGAFMSFRNGGRIKEVNMSLNGRLGELIEATRRIAHQEGVDEGKTKP